MRALVRCPKCGAEVVNPEKTWQLVAPLPDAEGRVTIIVMGSFRCPKCGHRWRAKVSSVKVGPEGEVEVQGRRRRKRVKRREVRLSGQVIEVDLSDIEEEL